MHNYVPQTLLKPNCTLYSCNFNFVILIEASTKSYYLLKYVDTSLEGTQREENACYSQTNTICFIPGEICKRQTFKT